MQQLCPPRKFLFPKSGPAMSNYRDTSCPFVTLNKTSWLFGFESNGPLYLEWNPSSLPVSLSTSFTCLTCFPYLNLASVHHSYQTSVPVIFLPIPPSSFPPSLRSSWSPHFSDLSLKCQPLMDASSTHCPKLKAPTATPRSPAQRCSIEIECKPQMWAMHIILNFLVVTF